MSTTRTNTTARRLAHLYRARWAARMATAALACGIGMVVAPGVVHAAKPSPASDLGSLHGADAYGSARAVNRAGRVVGNAYDTETGSTRQAQWWQGTVVAWGDCCGSGLGVPVAINRTGEVAGYNEGGFDTYPVYWSASGVAVELPGLPGGNTRGAAHDINDAGYVAGYTRDANGQSRHAVLWRGGVLEVDLGFMGQAGPGYANQSMAYGLNNQNVVVGTALIGNDYHAFSWQDGVFTDLGLGVAREVTDDGLTIAGTAPGGMPVVWRGGVRSYLPALGGGAIAYGHTLSAMNNKGQAVGFAPAVKAPYLDTAVLWRGGKAIDLGRYPGGTVSRAYGISDQGVVVGEGNLVPNGPMHALRWTLRAGGVAQVELQD
ncbi:hypothetical protein AACH06_28230 [Ideonella sp. DXS29W]|uniref:HAF repeat-containing protein n=1 Tax=Ideonella lacteola TaxID=2984193 RepID=A0ABU9C027_9BURK